MKTNFIPSLAAAFILSSCTGDEGLADAYGNFEVEEVTVSSSVPGELLQFNVEEGSHLSKGEKVGVVDSLGMYLQKAEIMANIELINSQYGNLTAQVNVLKSEKANVEREFHRIEKLLKSEAATPQQYDDLKGKLNVIDERIKTVESQNPNVFAQLKVAEAKRALIDEKLNKSVVVNPIDGEVLTKIARRGELAGPGSPLYKIADLSQLILRAYITGDQLTSVHIGDTVTVKTDKADGTMNEYPGKISWISNDAEFTPKIIQTKEERVDLVYAVKIIVANDGSLKIGMPGEVYFNSDRNAED